MEENNELDIEALYDYALKIRERGDSFKIIINYLRHKKVSQEVEDNILSRLIKHEKGDDTDNENHEKNQNKEAMEQKAELLFEVNEEEQNKADELSVKLALRAMEELYEEQNFHLALIWGLIAMFGAAILFAVLTALMQVQMGFFSLAVGLIVGKSIAWSGKGLSIKFSILGAVLSFFSCLLGYIFSAFTLTVWLYGFSKVEFFQLITNLEDIKFILVETTGGFKVFMYLIAIYFGYRFARENAAGMLSQRIDELKKKES